MSKSINLIDPSKLYTVKDLYCLYRVGKPPLKLLPRHHRLLEKIGFNPLEFYSRLMIDLTLTELKLITILSLDRIGINSFFAENGGISLKTIYLFDTIKVYECVAISLHEKEYLDNQGRIKCTGMKDEVLDEVIRSLSSFSWERILSEVNFTKNPEVYKVISLSSSTYNRSSEWVNLIEVSNYESLRFTESRYGTFVRSRPFREGGTYPLIPKSRPEYRLRDIMYGADSNTCTGWIKYYKKKLSLFQSEYDIINFLHKPLNEISEGDIIEARNLLSLTQVERNYLNYFEMNLSEFELYSRNGWSFNPISYYNYMSMSDVERLNTDSVSYVNETIDNCIKKSYK